MSHHGYIDFSQAPLGKSSAYVSEYDPSLLFAIPRDVKRREIEVPFDLPFYGYDTWNGYELSWLNRKGKPVVALMQCDIACDSTSIIESKSFKLYLNSFNNTKFSAKEAVLILLQNDLSKAVQGQVEVVLYDVDEVCGRQISSFEGECLDALDVRCDTYTVNPGYLTCSLTEVVDEALFSHLLKSNCLVTGQPDWGSIMIDYEGPTIDRAGLLQYLVSFRNHNEFHEQCVERIYMDIIRYCSPTRLMVEARYTRRGGLDINPIRSSVKVSPSGNMRLARQ